MKNATSKNKTVNYLRIILVLTLASCSKDYVSKSGSSRPIIDSSTIISTAPPFEQRVKVAPNQLPAFIGQTRIGAVHTKTKIKVTVVTNKLNKPWGISFLPDGRMLVTEKPGTIRIVTTGGLVSNPITGVPPVKYSSDSGLLSIVLDPNYSSTRLVFWTFVEPVAVGYITSICRARLSDDETHFENATVIYRANPSYTGVQHNGSRLIFDNNGNLYACFGEHYDDGPRVLAQSLTASIGKIIRINKNGQPAHGNPFEKTPGGLPEIWSLGHRDPQGLAFNPVTGDLWESEHGPQGGDEINIIKPGKNYGWPVIAYGLDNVAPNIGQPIGKGTILKGMEQPVYYWDPAIAPSGITFYTGTAVPEWKNNLFVAALAGKHIARLVIFKNTVIGEERLLVEENQRFRVIVQGPDGALYAGTDQVNGRIYRIGIN